MSNQQPSLTPQQTGQLSRKAAAFMLRKVFAESVKTRVLPKSQKSSQSQSQSLSQPQSSNQPKLTKLTSQNPPTSTTPKPSSNLPPRMNKAEHDDILRRDMHGRERKSTPTSDPLHYTSSTLPRPATRSQTNHTTDNESPSKAHKVENLRWIVDSREQFENVANRRGECEDRNTMKKRLNERKMKNNTTSIHWKDGKTEYTTDTMRSYLPSVGASARDPFQDIKRAKALKEMLRTSNIDLGSGFGGGDNDWMTDMQRNWKQGEDARKESGNSGRNPAADKAHAKLLKQHLQRTTLSLSMGDNSDYITDTKRCYTNIDRDMTRDPFQDIKRARALKERLRQSNIDLGSGFGGGDSDWMTDMQRNWKQGEDARRKGGKNGRDVGADRLHAKLLKQHLQRTTLQLGFDPRYM